MGHPRADFCPPRGSGAIASKQRTNRRDARQDDEHSLGTTDESLNGATEADGTELDLKDHAAIAEVGCVIGSTLLIEEAYVAFARQLGTLVSFDRLVISTLDLERKQFTTRYVAGTQITGFETGSHHPYAGPLSEGVLASSEPIRLTRDQLTDFVESSPESAAVELKTILNAGLNSTIQVPLVTADGPVGIMGVWSRQDEGFDEHATGLAARVGRQIAGAIANAWLHEKVERESAERSALAEIARIVGSSLDMDAICEAFANELAGLIPFDRIAISTVDVAQNVAVTRYSAGVIPTGYEAGRVYRYAGSWLADMLETRKPFLLSHQKLSTLLERDYIELYAKHGLIETIQIPLVSGDKPIGVLSLWSKTDHDFGEKELSFTMLAGAYMAGAISNSQLYESATADARALTALAEIGRSVSSDLDFDAVCAAFERSIKEIVHFRRLSISSWDHENQVLTTRYASGVQIPDFEPGTRHGYQESPLAKTLNGAEIVSIPEDSLDCFSYPEFITTLRELGFRGSLHLPLISNDIVIGTVSLWSDTDFGYTEAEQNILALATPYLASALSKALLYDDAVAEARIQEAIAEIGRTVSSSPTMDEVYRTFVGQLMRLVQCDRVVINSVDETGQTLTPVYVEGASVPGVDVGTVIELTDDGWSAFTEHPGGVIFEQEEIDLRADFDPHALAVKTAGLRSIASVPLEYRGEIIGALTVHSRREHAYGKEHLSVLRRVSGQIAGAFANARLYRQTLEDAAELRKLDEERSRFLSTVSHELRTPLTSIVAFADILARNADQNLTPRQLKQLAVMQRSGRRLDTLISDLLDVSRINEGQFSLDKTEFAVQELLSEVVDGVSPATGAKNQRLEIEQPKEPVWIKADRGRIAQVIANLLTNASKYSPAGRDIKLHCETRDELLAITVTDNGIGLPEEDLANLFTPFFRADNEATRSEAGTGLGLLIVKSIVDLHGGTIGVESEPGKGTSVRFTLPDPAPGPSAEFLEQQESAEEIVPRSRLE